MARTLNDLTAPAKEARAFDRWFDSLPKKQQEKLREGGVIPYREMVQSRNVFEVNPEHPAWATKTDATRVETEAFISRDHVGRMLRAFIDALSVTNDYRFRRHVELIRWTMALPGCLSAPEIAKMFGITKQALHKRAANIRSALPLEALGDWEATRRRK